MSLGIEICESISTFLLCYPKLELHKVLLWGNGIGARKILKGLKQLLHNLGYDKGNAGAKIRGKNVTRKLSPESMGISLHF